MTSRQPGPLASLRGNRSFLADLPVTMVVGWALVLLAAKFWLIATYGNNTPYWDQWDAQAAYLYAPWLAGDLRLDVLVSAHNEHRILFTRLLALALLQVNGLWNPLLEMGVNAILHFAAVLSAALLLGRAAAVRHASVLLLAAGVLLYCVPFGWENTLSGFQSQFYFVVVFSLWALWMLQSPAFGRRWWIGILLCACAYFSLASGILVTAAAASVIVLRMLAGQGRRRDPLALLLLLAMFLVGYLTTPTLPGHAAMRAASAWQFMDGTITALAWPFFDDEMALVRNAPLLVLLVVVGHERPRPRDPRWYILGVGAWSVLVAMALAFGRGGGVVAPRYLDLYAVAVLANAAALLALAVPALGTRHRKAAFTALLAWTFVCAASFERLAASPILARTLAIKRDASHRQQVNLAEFLRTRDVAGIAQKRLYELPYPDAQRLARITSDPKLVAILPPELQPVPPGSVAPGRLDGLVTWLLAHWDWLLAAGAALIATTGSWSLFQRWRRVASAETGDSDQVVRRSNAA